MKLTHGLALPLLREQKFRGPDVQSIVNLTTSLRHQLIKFSDYIIKYTVIFCWKNVRIFCRFSHFLNKKYQRICNIYILNFNETLTNDVVNFEQPGPD